jgi:hypothetical protein
MALELAIISAVAGAVLGLRYNVLVLVPSVMFAMLFAVIVGVARADSAGSVALMTVTLGVAVQLGYVGGVAISAAIESLYAALVRSRNLELSSLGEAAWPRTWQTQLTPSAAARFRQHRSPQA